MLGGVKITAIVQFGQYIDANEYEDEWLSLAKFTNHSEGKIYKWMVANTSITDPDVCEPFSKTLKFLVPQIIWNTTNVNETETLVVGTTVDWICPSDTKLSRDDDGYNGYDDKYTILCTTRSVFDTPKKTVDWPQCGKSCMRRLPYVPLEKTGLIGMDSENTVPSGQYGTYRCIDTTLGVEAVNTILKKCTNM